MDDTLIDKVKELIETDDCDRVKQSKRLIGHYNAAHQAEKELLDAVFICLCGYSLETLIKEL